MLQKLVQVNSHKYYGNNQPNNNNKDDEKEVKSLFEDNKYGKIYHRIEKNNADNITMVQENVPICNHLDSIKKINEDI